MPRLLLAAIAAVLVFTATPQAGDAQAQGRVVQTPRTAQTANAPSGRFRARAASERLATARTLLSDLHITISPEFLNSPFALTPQQPDASARGWLEAENVFVWWTRTPAGPWYSQTGAIRFTSSIGEVNVHLENAHGRRFLVDCTVHGATNVRARTPSGASTTVNATNGAILSAVTLPGENLVTINTVSAGEWRLLGCEITRIQ